jgi:hypothetical protein
MWALLTFSLNFESLIFDLYTPFLLYGADF